MKNILVMGGTSFAGKALVRELLRQDFHVTVATRGQAKVAFEGSVEWVQFERTDLDSMVTAFSGKAYDVVFDQIGYCGRFDSTKNAPAAAITMPTKNRGGGASRGGL